MRTDIINKYYSKTLRYLIAMLFILPAFTTTSGYELPNDRETLYLQKVAPSSLILAVEASQSDVEPVWDLSRTVVQDDCRQRWRNFGDSVLVRIENGTQIFFEKII